MDTPLALDDAVRACFEAIYDPCSVAAATPISIWDMGLVQDWRLDADDVLAVRLCVTFGACTMAPHFVRAAEEQLGRLPGVSGVAVTIDTSIVWTPERMTARGREALARRPERFTRVDMPRPRQWEERAAAAQSCG